MADPLMTRYICNYCGHKFEAYPYYADVRCPVCQDLGCEVYEKVNNTNPFGYSSDSTSDSNPLKIKK